MESLLLGALRVCLDRALDNLFLLGSLSHGRRGGVGGSLQTWTIM